MYENTFSNKVIAITGAASGIGLSTSHLLASRGATLSLADLSPEALRHAQTAILKLYPSTKILTHALDVRSARDVQAWMKATIAEFGRLDGAANLAGITPGSISGEGGKVENMDEEEWEKVMGVNAGGVMICLREELRVMKVRRGENGGGNGGGESNGNGELGGKSIVNASSIAGTTGRAMNGAYASSKHAVIGLTRSAAKEVGVEGVRVNAICPGRINTPMLKAAAQAAIDAGNGAVNEQETRNEVALQRNGEPEEVARLIAFLLSDESTYITGASIAVDGGWAC